MIYQSALTTAFTTLDYLKSGNDRQRNAYAVLTENNIMTGLQQFDPILVGTIPINMDIENSDLDIICYYQERTEFINCIKSNFCNFGNFKIRESNGQEPNAVIANFKLDNVDIEIFGQDITTKQQMLIGT